MSLRQQMHKPVSAWHVLALMALGVAAWFGAIFYDTAGLQVDARRCRAESVGRELIHTMNSTNLDGITKEFTADLASILEPHPWMHVDPPRREDRKNYVRVRIGNYLGQALVMLLQDKGWWGGYRFRLLSYERITQPVAPPNGGPTRPSGHSAVGTGPPSVS
jgi:hypothetical protein